MFKDGIYDFFFQILWLSKFFHSETKKKKKKTEKKQHNVAIEPRHYDQPVKQVKSKTFCKMTGEEYFRVITQNNMFFSFKRSKNSTSYVA